MFLDSYKNKELTIWSVFVVLLWLFLQAAVIAWFFLRIIPLLKGTYNCAAADFNECIRGLLYYTPVFFLTEEVPVLRNTFVANPSLRPAFAFTLVSLAIYALVDLSYVLLSNPWISLIALILGRLTMCVIFYKHPMDRFQG